MSGKKNPIISLIIPTRERADTLKYTLRSALNQSTTDYEIIVSDNKSQDDTEKVVKGFTDSRILYLNTGKRMSMRDNWDYALPHARGDYVIFIGDDDGVMPNAIDRLQTFIIDNPSSIYSWKAHIYHWPIGEFPPEIAVKVPKQKPSTINLNELVRFALRWGGWRYSSLPLLYHAAVSRKILDNIRQKTGRVFHSTNPDIFMAFTLPVFSDTAINVGESITVHGKSAKSNSSFAITKKEGSVIKQFVNEYGDYRIHSTLDPTTPFSHNLIADAALVAMDLFPEYYKNMNFNYTAMWAFVDRISFYKNTKYIWENRNALRKFHPINTPMLIVYMIAHKIVAFIKKIRDARSSYHSGELPSNINEFVQFMDSHP